MRFNGDTGSNYSRTSFRGDGSAASDRASNETLAYLIGVNELPNKIHF
jgi:hypothetical protein